MIGSKSNRLIHFVLMALQRETQGRQVRGGGVLYEPGGKRILNYYWNIGKDTNNKAEAYALLKGLQLAKTHQILNLNVLGDSKTVIRMMVQGTDPKNLSLKRIIDRIRVDSQTLKPTFFHILREHNKATDNMANEAIGKSPGTLGVEGVEALSPLT
jgi:ribonuclease HI